MIGVFERGGTVMVVAQRKESEKGDVRKGSVG